MNTNNANINLSYDWMCRIFLGPLVTEKAHINSEKHKIYTVQVHPDASKSHISHAFEKLFEIKPANVNILVQKGKTKQRKNKGKSIAVKMPDTKKAMIRLPANAKFDFAHGE